ncbi:hypothetical protein ACIQCM_07600 [Pseudarthrobacter sp. NPDC092439]|uniref:hypothetical protein n=1 Tax=unclassified Pseudarthrobacter TaxID=2647000 RepID=UPI00382E7355
MSDTAGNHHDRVVDQLLLEAGLDDDGQLRPALLELHALAGAAPEPSAAIAALMAGHAPQARTATAVPAHQSRHAGVVPSAAAGDDFPVREPAVEEPPVDELAARRRFKRRATLTALSVAVSLTAGGAVAAASDQGIRQSISDLNVAVTAFVTGGKPAGDAPEVPGGQDVPLPAGPAPTPAAPSPAPDGGTPSAPAVPGAGTTAPGKDPGIGTGGGPPERILPSELPGGLTGGVEQPPKVPVDGYPDVPLPDALPEPPLP